jgi:hypothetical protein
MLEGSLPALSEVVKKSIDRLTKDRERVATELDGGDPMTSIDESFTPIMDRSAHSLAHTHLPAWLLSGSGGEGTVQGGLDASGAAPYELPHPNTERQGPVYSDEKQCES